MVATPLFHFCLLLNGGEGGVNSEKKQFAQIRANYADMGLGIVPLDREYHVN